MNKRFWPIFRTFYTNRGKMKLKIKKTLGKWVRFLNYPIKIRLCGNFHENLLQKLLTHFSGHFWLIEAKMKINLKKMGKCFRFFNSPYQNWYYVVILMKIGAKIFWHIFKTFLTNWGKSEDENEKICKNKLDFWILHIKIKLCRTFRETLRKKAFSKFLPEKDILGQVSKGLIQLVKRNRWISKEK